MLNKFTGIVYIFLVIFKSQKKVNFSYNNAIGWSIFNDKDIVPNKILDATQTSKKLCVAKSYILGMNILAGGMKAKPLVIFLVNQSSKAGCSMHLSI